MKEKITIREFNSIPSFFHNGKESIEIEGKIYNKIGVFKLLLAMGMIVAG